MRGDDEPMRSCVACRAVVSKDDALRFVRAPDGSVGFDVRARLDGRGASTCADPKCVLLAVERGAFGRAFDAAVVVEAQALQRDVAAVLAATTLQSFGLAYRAGQLVAGRDEVLRAFVAGGVDLVVVAHDLSERSRAELHERLPDGTELVTGPGKQQIGDALGKKPVGVVAVLKGSAARRARLDALREARFLGLLAGPSFAEYKPGMRGQQSASPADAVSLGVGSNG